MVMPRCRPRSRGEDFQDGARAPEAALGRLVGIGGGADGDVRPR